MDKELFEVSEQYIQTLSALSGVDNSYGQLVARMMQNQNQGSDLDSNSKYRKELQALQSEYEDVVSRLNHLESEPNKTKTKSSAPETHYFQKSHSSKGHKVEFTAEQMDQHLLEIIMLNMKQVFEIRDVNEISDPVVDNEPVLSS